MFFFTEKQWSRAREWTREHFADKDRVERLGRDVQELRAELDAIKRHFNIETTKRYQYDVGSIPTGSTKFSAGSTIGKLTVS